MVLNDKFIRGDANVERIVLAPSLPLDFPFLLRTKVSQDLESRAPPLELHLPVNDDGCRHYNKVWTPHPLVTGKGCEH